jgi:DNA-binding response OmpR family regulator
MKAILLVDDEQEILDILKKKLEKSNYTVDTASSGEEALSMCKSLRPDLLLLDIAMPAMDGYAVAIELKKQEAYKNLPIIFLTAKELDPLAVNRRVGEIGAFGYMMKPCSFEDLLAKIKSAIG